MKKVNLISLIAITLSVISLIINAYSYFIYHQNTKILWRDYEFIRSYNTSSSEKKPTVCIDGLIYISKPSKKLELVEGFSCPLP